MNKYIDAELLRKKVQEQINYAKGVYPKGSMEAERATAIIAVCLDILASIDSLQQEQLIQVNTLTWKDVNDLERIINNVHYEFRNGIGEKSFGEEVLERFREERSEQKQPKVDLEKYIENEINHYGLSLYEASYGTFSASQIDRIIRNAFELGQREMWLRITNPEYNAKVVERIKSEYPTTKED